nr:MAG TPA: hypothetical protein [Caudoviricetes sp.]
MLKVFTSVSFSTSVVIFIPLLYYQLKTSPTPPQESVLILGVGILNFNKRMINLN